MPKLIPMSEEDARSYARRRRLIPLLEEATMEYLNEHPEKFKNSPRPKKASKPEQPPKTRTFPGPIPRGTEWIVLQFSEAMGSWGWAKSDIKDVIIKARSIYVTALFVAFICGILSVSFVLGWIWFGGLWGTIAAFLFQYLVGIVIMPVVDHVRYTITKDTAESCMNLAQDMDAIDDITRDELTSAIRNYFGI